MNIKILDSWLREYLKTKATPKELAEKLSLTSMAVERVEKHGSDYIYEMEITTNRPDLFSVIGIAKEASAILPQFGISADFIPLKLNKPQVGQEIDSIEIVIDPKLVNRICAVVMDVRVDNYPKDIAEKLETSSIRSLNNVVDVTNYVMRVVGHPAHVFDFERLSTKKLTIREAKKGEAVITLDGKNFVLSGGEIVAEDDLGRIVDLLGIMGLKNSVVTNETKKILYFIDNNNPHLIRNASMELGIRTEAATLNEKNIDPELAYVALLYGIELFEKFASGKVTSEIIDIYGNKPKPKTIQVNLEKINKVIGVNIDIEKVLKSLEKLGFEITQSKTSLEVKVPTFRLGDVEIEEDIIEEIARIYGYHNLPSVLPVTGEIIPHALVDDFYFEERVKEALKYWGFTEVYTYSFVSEQLYEGPIEDSVEVSNPLTEDFVYMRNSLIPSLLRVLSENKSAENIRIFEISNIYKKRPHGLPQEIQTLSGLIRSGKVNFFEVKGIIEQLIFDLGIKNTIFKPSKKCVGASVFIAKEYVGEIEVLDTNLIDFELNFETILKYANLQKEFKPFAKFPPIMEDLSVVVNENTSTEDLLNHIKSKSILITGVSLKDSYKGSRTFHIIYQDFEKNLTNDEVKTVRDKIISSLKENFTATIK